jgi:hypothetical protein
MTLNAGDMYLHLAKLLEGFMTNGRIIIVVKKEGKSRFEISKTQNMKNHNWFFIFQVLLPMKF